MRNSSEPHSIPLSTGAVNSVLAFAWAQNATVSLPQNATATPPYMMLCNLYNAAHWAGLEL